jgi:hypothetical protein
MRRRVRLIGAAAPIALAMMLPSCAAAGPKVVFDQVRQDLGVVPVEKSALARFTLRNGGDRPLAITSVEVDCGCLSPEYPRTLAPGARGELQVRFQPHILWSGKVDQEVRVYTDDPAREETLLAITADVLPLVGAEPRGSIVVQYEPGKVYRREVRVAVREGERITVNSASSDLRYVKAKLSSAAPGKRREYRLLLEVGPVPLPGDFNGRVVLATSDRRIPQLPVPVALLAKKGVVAAPRDILVPSMSGEERGLELRRVQVLSRGTPFRVLGVETGNAGLVAEVRPKTPGRVYDVVLKYAGGWKPGLVETTIRIRTSDPLTPVVKVPFTAQVR